MRPTEALEGGGYRWCWFPHRTPVRAVRMMLSGGKRWTWRSLLPTLRRPLPTLAEPSWTAFRAAFPPPTVCLPAGEPTRRPDTPRAPSARLLADLDPAGARS